MTDNDDAELRAAWDAAESLRPQDLTKLQAPHMLAASARYYAEALRWRIFPLAIGGKTPLTRNGFKDASNDIDVVRSWWQRWPQANIGTPTGERFDVIDIDAPDGYDTWAAFQMARFRSGKKMPWPIALAHTGSGGRHVLINPTGGNNGANWGRGLDYRGKGGYVVLPPSRLDAGGIYSWLTAPVVTSAS